LLNDRVAVSLDALVDALRTITAGGTVLDPEVVAQLLVARRADPLAALTPPERDVLRLMAEGRSNAAIADALVITGGAVAKHVSNIFAKINLPDRGSDNRPRPRGPHLAQGALTAPHSPICQPLRGLSPSGVLTTRREAAVVSPPRRRSAPGGGGPGAAPPPPGRQRRAVGAPARSAGSRRPRDPRAR
jgi:DNA-binding CsgD family transcriptional regulator